MSLLKMHRSWVELLHSGWPVFPLAALVENEFRDPPTHSLAAARMDRQEPSEGCSPDQEVFHTVSTLFGAEGRTARLFDMRDFLRWQAGIPCARRCALSGAAPTGNSRLDIHQAAAGRTATSCWAAVAVAYAGLADALQCHWRRPRSWHMHALVDVAVKQAQRGALKAFGRGPKAFNALIRSRWFLLTFLARLRPRLQGRWSPAFVAHAPVVVSWSSREVELGGTNWARKFVQEVFGDRPGVELEEDLEWHPPNIAACCLAAANIVLLEVMAPLRFEGFEAFQEIFSLTERPRKGPVEPAPEEEETLELWPAAVQESALVPIQDAVPEGRSSPRPWEPARVRKLKIAYGVTGAIPSASPRRLPEEPREPRVSRPVSRATERAPAPMPAKPVCAPLVRPATAAHGCLRGPWMPTGSTKPEPLQSFGRYLSPTKELLDALSGLASPPSPRDAWRQTNSKVTHGAPHVVVPSVCTSRLSRPTRPYSAPLGVPRRRSRKQALNRPGSPRPSPPSVPVR
eukprot:s3943_g2.t1